MRFTPPCPSILNLLPPTSHFWLTAFRNHIGLNDMITERETEALKHPVDIRLDYLNEGENKESKILASNIG